MPIPNLHISEAGYLGIFFAVLVVHLTEEFLGGTRSANPDKLHGLDLSRAGFIRTNVVVLLLFGVTIVLALKLGWPQFFLVALATFILINGSRHVLSTIKETAYSPGLVTGLLIFLPLGALTLIRLAPRMGSLRFTLAIATGTGMQLGASFIGHRGRQMVEGIKAKRAGA